MVPAGFLGVFEDGDVVKLEAGKNGPARFLFASAQKLNEPIARAGPFVMNTAEELEQAFLDYQLGRLG